MFRNVLFVVVTCCAALLAGLSCAARTTPPVPAPEPTPTIDPIGPPSDDAKDMPGAVREIEEAIALAPDDSRPYTSLGTLRLAEGDAKQAEAAYKRAVALAPNSVQPHLALAIFYWGANWRPQAEAELKAVLAIDEKHALANRILALFYLTTGRAAEAEAPLLRLAQTDDSGAILTVADHYARTKRVAEARSMYERLKGRKEMHDVAVTRLAVLDYKNGRREQAHAMLDEELKRETLSADVAALKAQLLISENRLVEAEEYAQKAVQAGPDSATAFYVLGLAQMARTENDAARKSFNEALRLNPKAAAAELGLSRLSLASGNADDALRRAESARSLEPKNLAARLGVAPQLGLDQHEVAIAGHQQVVDRPMRGRQLHADRNRLVQRRLDLSDRQAGGRPVDQQWLRPARGLPPFRQLGIRPRSC